MKTIIIEVNENKDGYPNTATEAIQLVALGITTGKTQGLFWQIFDREDE